MTSRVQRWLAFLPLVGTLLAVVVNLAVVPSGQETIGQVAAGLIAFLSSLSFAAIGGYLAFRIPRNTVGWLMAAYGFVFALVISSESVAATTPNVRSGNGWRGLEAGHG